MHKYSPLGAQGRHRLAVRGAAPLRSPYGAATVRPARQDAVLPRRITSAALGIPLSSNLFFARTMSVSYCMTLCVNHHGVN